MFANSLVNCAIMSVRLRSGEGCCAGDGGKAEL